MHVRKLRPGRAASTLKSTVVIPFPKRKQRNGVNRLTVADRMEAMAWAAGFAGLWCHLSIYADPSEHEDIGDFISIYKLGQSWASWGAARRDTRIVLWRADFGQDLGYFTTMAEALEAITAISG